MCPSSNARLRNAVGYQLANVEEIAELSVVYFNRTDTKFSLYLDSHIRTCAKLTSILFR